MNCTFYSSYLNECVVLKDCECENCSFRKTENEFSESRKRAADRLNDKGLVPYKKFVGGVQIVTVKKIFK